MTEALFNPGAVVGTPGALDALQKAGASYVALVIKHITGDWGELGSWAAVKVTPEELALGALATAEDDKLNAIAIIRQAGRVMSSYILATGVKVWVITDGVGTEEVYTTLLLPLEY